MASKTYTKEAFIPETEKKIALITKDNRYGGESQDKFGIIIGYKESPGTMKITQFREDLSDQDADDMMAMSDKLVVIEYDDGKVVDSTEVWWTAFSVVIRSLQSPTIPDSDKKIMKRMLANTIKITSPFVRAKIKKELGELIAVLRQV